MPQKKITQFIQREALKDEKLQQVRMQAAEAAIQGFVEDGLKIKAEYEEKRVKMDFTLSNSKEITLKVDYENLASGFDNIKAFINQLDK